MRDRDHTGALMQLLAEAPNARVVTSFVSVGIMGVGNEPIPPERRVARSRGEHRRHR